MFYRKCHFCLMSFLILFFLTCIFSTSVFPANTPKVSLNKPQVPDKIQNIHIELTEEEIAFLKSHPVIKFGTDETWAPYVSKRGDGKLEGFDVDFLRYINESTGANIQLITGSWAEIVEKAEIHKIDGLATSAPVETRKQFFLFSQSYVSEFPLFVINSDSPLKISKMDDFSGKRVAFQGGNEFYISLLKPYPAIKVIEASNEIESIKLMLEGKADAAIVSTSTYHELQKQFLGSIRIGYVATDKPLKVVYSIRKDWPELLSIINKSIEALPRETYNSLFYKWFQIETVQPYQLDKKIRTVIVDNYFPYTFVNEQGEPDGLSVELIKAVAKELGMDIGVEVNTWSHSLDMLLAGEVNVLSIMAYSEERDKKFDFSAPYTIAFDAYFTRKGSPKNLTSMDLKEKKIIVNKKDQAHDYLKTLPFITEDHFVYEGNTAEALKMLSSGKGDVAVMPKVLGLVLIKKLKIENLVHDPPIIQDYERPFSFAVKEGNLGLLERLENGLQIIKETGEYQKIHNKWLGAYEHHEISFAEILKRFFWTLLVFILIAGVLLLWTFMLRRQVALRTRYLEAEITERKQAEDALRESEDKYRTILENIEDGYYEVDNQGDFTFFNDALCEIYGYSGNEMMGINIRKFTDPETAERGYEVFKKVNVTRKSEKGFEWVITRKDGAKRTVEGSVSLKKDTDGAHMGFRGIIRDITEKQRLEDQLQQAQKMEAIGTLAGGVAHDLNNILGGLVSYPELLLLQLPEDSPLRRSILTIQKSGEKAAAVVQDLLTLARRGVVVTEVVNLNAVISEYLKSPEHGKLQSYHPGVHIETHLEEDVLNILGSPTHLSTTVMNLVSNAAEAMPEGGKLSISTENRYFDRPIRGYDHVKEGDYMVLTISDTGTGISPDDMEKIFEPFYTKKKMGRSGTGLGMAVVWGTVKDHNGYIDVQSAEGKGTTFTLYFPVTRKSVEERSEISIKDYMGKGEGILVVDDVEEQRQTASGMLRELGYSVAMVSSGEEAVEYLRTNKIDLLVLDMIMDPGMDGLETYRKIIEIHPGQKAIIASGFSETDRVKKVLSLGAGAYIRKPFLLEKIGVAVKKELEK